MRNAFSDALMAAAKSDPRVLLLTGDHGYALFDAFRRECPAQYINCGIAEQNMVGVAAGLARGGFFPVVYGLAAFVPVRVMEQIKIDICYENLPVVLIGDGAGFVYSHLGNSHQSMEDIACARSLPALQVLSPGDRYEMSACMELAFRLRQPVYLRMGKSDRGDVHGGPVRLESGEMLCVRKATAGRALLATGSMLRTAIELIDEGLDAEIWSVPSIKPLNLETLQSIAQRHHSVFVLEEHSVLGGLGSCVSEVFASIPGAARVHRIGVEDRFSTYCGTYDYLLREHGLDGASIAQRIADPDMRKA
ncbi:MAG: transketolase [Rhodocyclales bacterium]|nr:transketolase [Rhodocyclales bacterium]